MDRRAMLKLTAAAGVLGPAAGCAAGKQPSSTSPNGTSPSDARRLILRYLASLARPDGGYGWEDQPDSHLTPTFAVIGCHRLLKQAPPDTGALARFVRTHHPITGEGAEAGKHAADLRTFVYQQIQSLLWLGQDAASFRSQVQQWTRPSLYPAVYEPRRYPVFQQEMMAFICRDLLGLPLPRATDDGAADAEKSGVPATGALSPDLVRYLESRRRPNGSFNNTPAADGSDGHLLNTWWGIRALRALGRANEREQETVAWLRACQLPSGGFTYRPHADIGGIDDVAYTWAAVLALNQFGAVPADRAGCVRWLRSLWNADGGFGDRPGLPSRPEATHLALEALNALGEPPGGRAPVAAVAKPLPAGLKPFTIQIEAQGNGSPVEAVELARALRIHLWGAKNAQPGWIERAQSIADRGKVPVRFFVSNEEYGTFVSLPGLGIYSHTSDPIAPAGVDFGPSMAGETPTPWVQFRENRIGRLEDAGGRMVWQICDNEEWSRVQLDDSVARGRGYSAISSFHFQQNFVYMLPFLFRYRHLIPFAALQDAHGGEAWWWADELAGYRTIFLAAEPTWDAWLEALKRQWVVAVRHDAVTRFRTRMLGGGPGVQDFLREHEAEWKWWGDEPDDIQRPLVSLVAVTPEDEFEAARPEKGVMIRVRCWWKGRTIRTTQVVELVDLSIDGNSVTPTLVEKRNAPKAQTKGKKRGGRLVDHYYQYPVPAPAPGEHTATATVRVIETRRESRKTIRFTVA